MQVWTNGSVCRSMLCSCRGPWFSSQHPPGGLQSQTFQFLGHMDACSADTHRLAESIEINTNGSLKQRFKMELQAKSGSMLRGKQPSQRINNSILTNKKPCTNVTEEFGGERACLARIMCSTLSFGEKKLSCSSGVNKHGTLFQNSIFEMFCKIHQTVLSLD